MEEETKICSRCKKAKSLKEFYDSKRGRQKKQSQCKVCEKISAREYRVEHREKLLEYRRQWNSTHKEHISERARKYRWELRLEVLGYYSNGMPKCADCGLDDIEVLCIDHINGGGRKHYAQIGTWELARWLRDNNYPTGYQVLCANCNMKKMRREHLKGRDYSVFGR